MVQHSFSKRILTSSFWEYIGSWLNKIIGFISTIVLARILTPDDFGIVSAAAIVTGLFHVMSSVGTNQYLIRKKNIEYFEYNTGWTINIIMRSLSAIIIFLFSEYIANFLGDERLGLVLKVISISPFLLGFANIGMVIYEKEYNYRPKFIIGIISRLIGFVLKIILAIYLRNYWAFVFAEIIEVLVLVISSFAIQKFRPRFSLSNWKQQWVFSQWILLKSIFVFVRFRIDNIFISKYLPLEGLGVYTVAKDVATLPAGQIIGPIMNPLYVSLSSIHKEPVLFADKAHKTLSMLFAIILPISLGIWVTADNLVSVLLGDQWAHATPIIMILTFTLLPAMLGDFMTRVMTALGKVKLIFKFELLLGFFTFATFALLAGGINLAEFAVLRVTLTTINTLFVLIVLTLMSSLSFFRIIGLILLPLLSSVLMALFLMDINVFIEQYSQLVQLCIQIIAGALIYLVFISLCIYLLRNAVKEYQFIWKTFYLSIFGK